MDNYITIQGDTWDIIARTVYGSEKYLDCLMANNFPLLNYYIFPAGVEVMIPSLPIERVSELPAWRL